MPLPPGTRIGAYEITSSIGAGGMGEVYRARDLMLHRDVAIKTLPELFVTDADRVARFEREAHTLAALNHPNIAQIHGLIGKTDGGPALVMELVEGEDLAERIARGAIPLDEALPIARQVADALQAAHDQGIVHRDLKPGNVKVRPDGTVKVLDFGLAKAMDPAARGSGADLALSPTFTSPAMTAMGMILGTAAYMAPEQARGKVVDKRADIWAFGCLLYEMISGKRAFAGDDVTETITSVMRDDPDWSALPASLSPSAERFLRRCFIRNPRERVQDAGDLRLALDGAYDLPATAATAGSAPVPAPTGARTASLAAGILAVALLAGAVGWWWRPAPATADERIRRFSISLAPGDLTIANTNHDIAFSPDGEVIAYFATENTTRNLYVRRLDSLAPTLLRRADRYFEPFISNDSRWIAFNDEQDFTLRKVAVTGGPPVMIAKAGAEVLGATWGDDDSIVYATEAGLWRVPAAGGTPVVVIKPDHARGELVLAWPAFLPGSKTVLYAVRSSARFNEWSISAVDLQSGTARTVVRSGTNPVYSRTGHLLYLSEQTLHGIAFDPARVETHGETLALLDGIQSKGGGAANVGVSAGGTLVYIPGGGAVARRELSWLDRSGAMESLGVPPRAYTLARVSPDGTRVALDVRDEQSDLWMWDVARRVLSRLTATPSFDGHPVWTRDGRSLVFSSAREGPTNLFVQPADGTGEARALVKGRSIDNADSITPDGKQVLFRRDGVEGMDVMIAPLDGSADAAPLLASKANEANGEVSPNAQWLAYESDESGVNEIYVRPFPRVESGRWQISYGGGAQPMWSPDSQQLYFNDPQGQLAVVRVTPGAAFLASRPERVTQLPFFTATVSRTYDISPDGKRFLIIHALAERGPQALLTIVENWAQELKKIKGK